MLMMRSVVMLINGYVMLCRYLEEHFTILKMCV